MKAIVTEPFDGVRDGEVLPVSFKAGDAVVGELAKTAVKFKQAEEVKEDGLESLTVQQLKDLAAQRGVDLGDASKKADIIAALEFAAQQAYSTGSEA